MDMHSPLHGSELVDCARANAKFGVIQATYQCGYGSQVDTFQHELEIACHQMGLGLDTLEELALTIDHKSEADILPQDFSQI